MVQVPQLLEKKRILIVNPALVQDNVIGARGRVNVTGVRAQETATNVKVKVRSMVMSVNRVRVPANAIPVMEIAIVTGAKVLENVVNVHFDRMTDSIFFG
jgi:hypothetical protein